MSIETKVDSMTILSVGTVVQVNYQRNGRWYTGTITSTNRNGYDIIYEDGSKEKGVARDLIRVIDSNNELRIQFLESEVTKLLLENELIKDRLQQLENYLDPDQLIENELIKDRLRQLENKQRELNFDHLRKYELTKTSFEELGDLQFKTENIIKTRIEQVEMKLVEDKITQRRQFIYILIVLIAFIGSRLI